MPHKTTTKESKVRVALGTSFICKIKVLYENPFSIHFQLLVKESKLIISYSKEDAQFEHQYDDYK